jgi:triacylglycerol esterase/lipase EstA (alpha/beta hydrolase family)
MFTTNKSASTIVHADTLPQLNNNYPIVMVHGLFGWGDNQMFGLNYWGGLGSLKTDLTNKGYTVFTPTVGPVSSNWDRACELYAYLKGGTVDYGAAHAKEYGCSRYGRTYPGVYPQWGNTSANGGINKVHLMGHSMGGETIRTLAQLLENGSQDEMNCGQANISPLFTGNKHWVDSITTIATPHDGSPVGEGFDNMGPYLDDLLSTLGAITGTSQKPFLDLDLDQWGLQRQPNESIESYYKRVFSSNIWTNSKDNAMYDLSEEGAKQLNSWVKAQSDIYYFSEACVDTHTDLLTQHQVPNINMYPFLMGFSFYIGQYTMSTPGYVPVDKTWWTNDGLVSLPSAMGPHIGSQDTIVNYNPNTTPQRGVWNYMGELDNTDHMQVVLQTDPFTHQFYLNKFYGWANMLGNLPQ